MSNNTSYVVVVCSFLIFLFTLVASVKYMDTQVDLACLEAAKVNPRVTCNQ